MKHSDDFESPVFTRGYKEVRGRMKNAGKFMRSCFNCMFYGREEGSKGEVCLNDDVTEYDLIVEGNMVSCTQWTPYTEGLKKKNYDIFGVRKRTGRNRPE